MGHRRHRQLGAGLTTALLPCRERIVEVDRQQRPARRGGVKSDDIEAAFAKLGGAAPIEASSETVIRHRLNSLGIDSSTARHTIVLVRKRQDSATKDYIQRRLAQGKTIRDIKRCVKRYIAQQLFGQLEGLCPRQLDGT